MLYISTFLEKFKSWPFIIMFVSTCNYRGKALFWLLNPPNETQDSSASKNSLLSVFLHLYHGDHL